MSPGIIIIIALTLVAITMFGFMWLWRGEAHDWRAKSDAWEIKARELNNELHRDDILISTHQEFLDDCKGPQHLHLGGFNNYYLDRALKVFQLRYENIKKELSRKSWRMEIK